MVLLLAQSLSLTYLSSDVSRTSTISVSAYLRTVAMQGPDDMGNDLLLGRVDLTPVLDGHVRYYVSPFCIRSFSNSRSTHQISGTAQPPDPAPSISKSTSNPPETKP